MSSEPVSICWARITWVRNRTFSKFTLAQVTQWLKCYCLAQALLLKYKFKQVDYESLKNNVNLNIFSLQGPELSHVGDRARVWQLRRKVGKHFVKFIQHLIKSKQYAWEKVPSCLWQNIIEFKWFPQKSENLTFEILSFDGYNNRTIITLDFMKYYRWLSKH